MTFFSIFSPSQAEYASRMILGSLQITPWDGAIMLGASPLTFSMAFSPGFRKGIIISAKYSFAMSSASSLPYSSAKNSPTARCDPKKSHGNSILSSSK